MLGFLIETHYLYYVIKRDNMKKNPLPKHRQLLMESFELLFSGKKTESKKVLKKAMAEVNKFYSK